MSQTPKIPATDEAWDEGALGRSEEFVAVCTTVDEAELDAGLELQQISIRLQKSLIEDFKMIAALHGLGYQPLMRQILTRFADSEKKMLLRDFAREQVAKQRSKQYAPDAKATKQRSEQSDSPKNNTEEATDGGKRRHRRAA
ncbi:hypothetical protein [Burkholderia gladioli]|uniref:hypothetical protein n=1 Tax=Burkholderia gladioli TaxID=28095 RepID=UPI001640529F|nr:hypothetical protein [Burkholderia gladioli]